MIPGFLLPVFRKRKNCQLSADKSVILWVDTSMTNWKFIRHMDMCRKLEWSKD